MRKIVRTQEMVVDGMFLHEPTKGVAFVCVKEMCEMLDIEFPEAQSYCLAASSTLWRDGPGTVVWIERRSDRRYFVSRRRDGRKTQLHLSDKTLARLDTFIRKPNTPTRIYLRLEYEE